MGKRSTDQRFRHDGTQRDRPHPGCWRYRGGYHHGGHRHLQQGAVRDDRQHQHFPPAGAERNRSRNRELQQQHLHRHPHPGERSGGGDHVHRDHQRRDQRGQRRGGKSPDERCDLDVHDRRARHHVARRDRPGAASRGDRNPDEHFYHCQLQRSDRLEYADSDDLHPAGGEQSCGFRHAEL